MKTVDKGLLQCVKKDDFKNAKKFLSLGAKIDVADSFGNISIMFAKSKKMLDLLLDSIIEPANVRKIINTVNNKKESALIVYAQGINMPHSTMTPETFCELWGTLKSNGVDTTIKDANNKLARDYLDLSDKEQRSIAREIAKHEKSVSRSK